MMNLSSLAGRVKSFLSHQGPPLLLILLFLCIWEIAVRISKIEKWLLPSPSQIVVAMAEARHLLGAHIWQTVQEVFLGFGLSFTVGMVLAVAIDASPLLRRALYPLLVASQTVPVVTIAPLLVIWFGYGIMPKVIVVALICFFPIAVSLVDGLGVARQDKLDLLRAMGATRGQTFRVARLPAALPSLFSGLRISATYSVIGAIIGEWMGASLGLGIFINRSSNSFLTDRVFGAIAVSSLLSIALFVGIDLLARVVMPWYYVEERGEK